MTSAARRRGRPSPGRQALTCALARVLAVAAACSADPPPSPGGPVPAASPGPPAPAGSAAPSSTPSASPRPSEPAEPTTTNTLPPPPEPSAPAPSTAGDLDAHDLVVPAGWRTVALEGGEEEGYRGNGTWVHARDARYAAQDVITIGCADVTRDDYTDPTTALEGSYVGRTGAPGVGLLLEFGDVGAATRYWDLYTAQVRACTRLRDPVHTELVPVADGLVDRRTYPDSSWTEVARRTGSRVTLVILSDEGRRTTTAEARRLLARIG